MGLSLFHECREPCFTSTQLLCVVLFGWSLCFRCVFPWYLLSHKQIFFAPQGVNKSLGASIECMLCPAASQCRVSLWLSGLCPAPWPVHSSQFSSKNLPFPFLVSLSAEEHTQNWKHEGITAEHLRVQALTVLREVMTFWVACSEWKHSCARPESLLSYSKICTLFSLKAKINCNSLTPLSPGIELNLLFPFTTLRKKDLGHLHWTWECPPIKLCIAVGVAWRVVQMYYFVIQWFGWCGVLVFIVWYAYCMLRLKQCQVEIQREIKDCS